MSNRWVIGDYLKYYRRFGTIRRLSNIQLAGSVLAILVCVIYAAAGYQALSKSSAETLPADAAASAAGTPGVIGRSGTATSTPPATPKATPTPTKPAPTAAPAPGTPGASAAKPGTLSPSAAAPTGLGGTILMNVYTTAYTYFDNTPAGTADIAFSHQYYPATIHNQAGGTGTYNDPITLAVGHVIIGGKSTPDFAPGTRFYLPDVRKYAIVEDVCGDGQTPQNIPCHKVSTAPRGTTLWLDLWIGGSAGDSASALDNCAGIVTDSTGALHTVVKDPSPGYAVHPGPVYQNGYCIQPSNKGFGNALVAQ